MGRAFEFRKARKMKRWSAMAKTFTKIGKDIVMAVKEGGPSPETNARLRAVIQNAKAANMPKDNVERAIKKASEEAKSSLVKIPLREGRTIHHDTYGKSGSGKVLLRSAPAGTGIIAGGAIRAICEMLGMQDIVAKSIGSSNPYNVVRACMFALSKQRSPKDISILRGKKISEVVARR